MSHPYELEPAADYSDAPRGVIVRETLEDAIEIAASELFIHAMNCTRAFGDVHLAFSGGATLIRLYHALMLDPQFRVFPWKRTHLWVVSDEINPGRDPVGTSAVLRELVVDHADLPQEQFHPIPARADADAAYAKELRATLGWREPGHDRLDYVLLGLGSDGSTAGLTHPSDIDDESLVHRVPSNGAVSMGMRLINASRFVGVLAGGTSKHTAVTDAINSQDSSPAAKLKPIGGELRWYLDQPAYTGREATDQ